MPKASTFDGGSVSFPRITSRSDQDDDVIAQPEREERFDDEFGSLVRELVLEVKKC